MPLFEVEGDRPQIVPGARPGVGTTAHRVVETHIDGLLGEQIFPVSPGSGPDEPHLLALDASGAPVVVELVSRLDDAALSRALDHAGAAGRMTRSQLASLYRGGPAAFQRDVAEFYDAVPITRSQPGRPGVRLIVICQDADEDVLNAVDFLRQPNMPVEVLRLGLVHGEDGRRFVDVSPLVIHPSSAPDRPELVARPEGVAPLTALAPRHPVVVPSQSDPLALPDQPASVPPAGSRVPDAASPALSAEPAVAPGARPDASQAESSVTTATAERPTVSRRSRASRAEARAASPEASSGWTAASSPAVPTPLAVPLAPVTPAPVTPAPVTPAAERTAERPAVRRRSRADRFTTPPPTTPDVPTEVEATTYLPPLSADAPSRAPHDHGVPDRQSHDLDASHRFAGSLDLGPSSPGEDPLAWRPSRAWSPDSGEDPLPTPPHGESDARPFGEVLAAISSPLDPRWDSGSASSDPAPWEPAPAADPAPWAPRAEQAPAPAPAPAPWETPAEPARAWWEPERRTSSTPIVLDDDNDPDLAALAATLGVPTPLVWERPRRGERYEALLHPDGTIELAGGARYRHPDVAASAASGSYTADGWTVWRLSRTGETLTEAFRKRFT